jgi:hypothetical protein
VDSPSADAVARISCLHGASECWFASLIHLCYCETRMSAQIFVGGLGAVAPETAAFFDKVCRLCAVCETCKAIICKVLG